MKTFFSASTIARKELACFFFSPVAYALLFLVSLGTGYWFFGLLAGLQGQIRDLPSMVFSINGLSFWLVCVLMIPPITMRLLTEEKRSGTMETLMTAPVTDLAVVLGKYFAAFFFYLILWLPSLLLLGVVYCAGGDFDLGLFTTGFLSVCLTGAVFLSFGLFASSIATNAMFSAALGLLSNVAFLLGPLLVGAGVRVSWLRSFFEKVNYFGMVGDSLEIGILDSSYVIYALSVTALFLFFTVRVLESRKWK